MNPQQTEQIRLAILRYTLSPISLGLITSYLRAEGFTSLDRTQVQAELQYLIDKDLLRIIPNPLSPATPLHRISAQGRDLLATQSAN